MIKKSLFEEELIHGMQRELHSHEKKQGMNNLVKAADYLNAAVEIFEEAGMTAKADQVLRLLGKIAIAGAHDSRVKEMPSINKLMEAGVTPKDLKNTQDPSSRARVNTAMRVLGYTDREIKVFLGDKFMSEDEAADILNPEKPYGKLMDWIQNPTTPVDPNNPQPGEEISLQSLPDPTPSSPSPDSGLGEIKMKSLLASEKSRIPTLNDTDTKGLTSEKMIANLSNHGTVFNMTDSNKADVEQPKAFEKDWDKWKSMRPKHLIPKPKKHEIDPDLVGLIETEDADDQAWADSCLDLDLNEAADELLEGNPEDKTFEDSD